MAADGPTTRGGGPGCPASTGPKTEAYGDNDACDQQHHTDDEGYEADQDRDVALVHEVLPPWGSTALSGAEDGSDRQKPEARLRALDGCARRLRWRSTLRDGLEPARDRPEKLVGPHGNLPSARDTTM